jgi:hypothetical protein
MIEAASIAFEPHDASPRRKEMSSRDDAPAFSYALAAASLEKSAARSLEAHGAKPKGAAAGSPQPSRKTESGDAQPAAKDNGGAKASRTQNAVRSADASAATPAADKRPAQGAASPIAPAAQAAPAAVSSQPALQAKGADAAAIRDAAAAKAKIAAPRAPRLPATPAALKTEFAEILARRLEKTSVFDLRLDPPELGRVEGRLSVNDDGKAVLTLAFDNQNAFDLFSRDEQALRQALQQAGLQFGAGDFVFAFRERRQPDVASADIAAIPSIDAPAVYDPVFAATWSAGALDIRI